MQRRYPQPVKVGDLIGLRVLDDKDRTLGRVQTVVRTSSGKYSSSCPMAAFSACVSGWWPFRSRSWELPVGSWPHST